MKRSRLAGAGAALALLLLPATPSAASAADSLNVSVDRTAIRTKLGHTFLFRSTIANRGPAPTAELIAHLNVLSLRSDVYVDPEDWSTHRTRYLPSIPAGGSTSFTWRLTAVNAGKLAVYVAVLPRSGVAVAPNTGPTIRVTITDRRTLDSGGILPVALGIPALLGLLTLALRVTRRGATMGRQLER